MIERTFILTNQNDFSKYNFFPLNFGKKMQTEGTVERERRHLQSSPMIPFSFSFLLQLSFGWAALPACLGA